MSLPCWVVTFSTILYNDVSSSNNRGKCRDAVKFRRLSRSSFLSNYQVRILITMYFEWLTGKSDLFSFSFFLFFIDNFWWNARHCYRQLSSIISIIAIYKRKERVSYTSMPRWDWKKFHNVKRINHFFIKILISQNTSGTWTRTRAVVFKNLCPIEPKQKNKSLFHRWLKINWAGNNIFVATTIRLNTGTRERVTGNRRMQNCPCVMKERNAPKSEES